MLTYQINIRIIPLISTTAPVAKINLSIVPLTASFIVTARQEKEPVGKLTTNESMTLCRPWTIAVVSPSMKSVTRAIRNSTTQVGCCNSSATICSVRLPLSARFCSCLQRQSEIPLCTSVFLKLFLNSDMEQRNADRTIIYYVLAFFVAFGIAIIVYLFERNQTNKTVIGDYSNVRVYCVDSKNYLVVRLAATGDYTDTTQTTTKAYNSIVAVGGTIDDPLGIWKVVAVDKSKGFYLLLNTFTNFYNGSGSIGYLEISSPVKVDSNALTLKVGTVPFDPTGTNQYSNFTMMQGDAALYYVQGGNLGVLIGPSPAKFSLRLA